MEFGLKSISCEEYVGSNPTSDNKIFFSNFSSKVISIFFKVIPKLYVAY